MQNKITLLIIFTFTLLSCTSKKNISEKPKCNENFAFKKVFFENVQNIEDFMVKQSEFKTIEDVEKYDTDKRVKSFNNSLKFISTYSKVSFESMLNYSGTYPYGIYEEDKRNWLKWYDENKCENIQFQNSTE